MNALIGGNNEKANGFLIQATNDLIWNKIDLIKFLLERQYESIELRLNPEAISAYSLGLYELLDCFTFEKVTIYTHNPFEKHNKYHIRYLKQNTFTVQDGSYASKFSNWNYKKRFLTIYARPTAGRLGLAAHLFEHHLEHSHVHFSWAPNPDNLMLFEFDKLSCYDSCMIESAGRLIKKMPLNVYDSDGYVKTGYNYQDKLTSLYQDCLVDIVVESHVMGETFFPTEKTFRPMWARRPFIAFSTVNYLLYLRQMGFMTFGEFWNEDYDGYEGKDRFSRIKKLIDDIASLTDTQITNLFKDMQSVLDHNYAVLSGQRFSYDFYHVV